MATTATSAHRALVAHQYARMRALMLAAVGSYEGAKQLFADITGSYMDGRYDAVTAEAKAAADPRRQKAIGDAAWYREEAAMYAAVCAALYPHVGEGRS